MPAPSASSIETFLKQSLISQGIVKQVYDPAGNPIKIPIDIPDDMKPLIKAISAGVANQWAVWQATQVVLIPVTSVPPAPSSGILP